MTSIAHPPFTHRARWWSQRGDGRIECQLCPRACKLAAGQRGFCVVRQRLGDEMALQGYGQSSGFCMDPIEKKPLNHFLPGTSVLSFGTVGCNLGCEFCQNWPLSRARDTALLGDETTPARIADAARSLGCRSVAFTYNDPVVFAEYAIDVARACHDRGVRTIAVTAGYINPSARSEFFAAMDATNVDLKAFTEDFYRRRCHAKLQPVLDTLVYLRKETSVWLEVTTLLIPGENDSDDELDRASDWFAQQLGPDVPWHFSAFHPDYKLTQLSRTPAATLARARDIARTKGLHYIYTGNVVDDAGQTTPCPFCGAALIERHGFTVKTFRLASGRCPDCGHEIAGHFEAAPGNWGARSLPVRLS